MSAVTTEDISPTAAEDMSAAATEDIPSIATEDVTSVATEDMSSIATEATSSAEANEISSAATENMRNVQAIPIPKHGINFGDQKKRPSLGMGINCKLIIWDGFSGYLCHLSIHHYGFHTSGPSPKAPAPLLWRRPKAASIMVDGKAAIVAIQLYPDEAHPR